MRGKEIQDRSGDSRKGHHNVRHTLLLSPPTDGDVSERGKGQLILRRFRLPLSECLPGNPPSWATGTGNALYLRQTRPLLPSLPSSEKGAPKHRCSTENEKSAHRPSLPGARSPGPGAPRVPTTVPTAPAARSCPPPPLTPCTRSPYSAGPQQGTGYVTTLILTKILGDWHQYRHFKDGIKN